MISCAHRIDIDRYDSASLAARIHLDRTHACLDAADRRPRR